MSVWLLYVIVVGEVLFLCLPGITVFSILMHSFGSCLASVSCFVSDCFFSCFMRFASLFRYCVCFWVFAGVGFCMRILCRSCCFWSCFLYLGVIHAFLRCFGVFAYVWIVV